MKRIFAFGRSFAALSVVLTVAACGGGGGGSSPPPTPSSKTFAADAGNSAIGSAVSSNPGPGVFAIDRIIQGPATRLAGGIPGMVVDAAADRMFVAVQGQLLVFDQAGLQAGNVPPSRTVMATVNKGGTNFGVNFFHLSLDSAANVLYTADPSGEVHIFNNASAVNGAGLTPDRTIVPTGGIGVGGGGIAIDPPRDALYVGSNSNTILVFNNARLADSTPNGTLAPNRTLTFSGGVSSFFLDTGNDRLYAAVNTDIQVFDNASTLPSGPVSATRTMNLGQSGWHIFVETSGNRLYAARFNTIVIVQNASTSSGAVGGTIVTVSGAAVDLRAIAVKP